MKSLGDLAKFFFKFLDHPNALGVLTLIATLLIIGYVSPMVVMAFLSWDNTNRLERAQVDGTNRTVNAIERLSNHLNLRTAQKGD